MASSMYKVDDSADLSEMTMEPHGTRSVTMEHSDFRRRFLNKYGQCTKYVADMVAVETTCKAIAKAFDSDDTANASNDAIAVVYGINVLKFDSVRDLTVDKVNNCYMDAAMDATKRLSTCIDIYYKNRDATMYHGEISGDGEIGGNGNSVLSVRFDQSDELEYSSENQLAAISMIGNFSGNINITITPKFCSLKNFKSNPNQVINADTVYELPVHTLAEINAELTELVCVPEAVGTVYLEIRANGALIKTLSLMVHDASTISFVAPTATEVNMTVGEAFNETGFTFEGELQKPATVTVTPYNCTVSGFFSDPATKLLANSKYRFVANTIETINQELSNLTVVPQAAGNCKIVVECLDMVAEITHDVIEPAVESDADLTFDINSSATPSVFIGVKTAIPPIVATGSVNKTIKVTVQSVGCTISGFTSDPDAQYAANSQYVFYVADVDALNAELAKLTVMCGSSGKCGIKIMYGSNEEVANFEFTASRDLVNVIVPVIDTCDKLTVDVETGIKPIDFRGRMEKDEATIKLTPTNCRVRGMYSNPGEVYTHDRPYTFTGNSLEDFNKEFARLYVTALRNEQVSIAIEILEDNSISVYGFEINQSGGSNTPGDNGDGNISSMVTVTSTHLNDELVVGTRSGPFDITFSGLEGLGQLDVKVTPRNCTLQGLKTTSEVIDSGNTYEFVAPSSAALIAEFDDIMITPIRSTGVKLEIELSDLSYILEFTNVIGN